MLNSVDRKRGQRKGATSKNVKKVSKIFLDSFRQFSHGTSFPSLGGSDKWTLSKPTLNGR